MPVGEVKPAGVVTMNYKRLKGVLKLLVAETLENHLEQLYGQDTLKQWNDKNKKAIDECFESIVKMIQDEREYGKRVLMEADNESDD